MKRDLLDDSLDGIKGEKLPDIPGNLEFNVLRKIRQRESASTEQDWSWVSGLLVSRSFIMTTFSLTIMLSILLTGFAAKSLSEPAIPIRESLHFESLTQAPLEDLFSIKVR